MSGHIFAESLQVGEDCEVIIDEAFRAKGWVVESVPLDAQRRGVDRIWKWSSGARFTVEYKADLQADQTHNVFVETVSVDPGEGGATRLGWGWTSEAQLLVYYVVGMGFCYIADMAEVRRRLSGWKKTYGTTSCRNNGYTSNGVLVPMSEFTKVAYTREDI